MTADERLGKAAQEIIAKAEIVVSTVSLWEMTLKNARGKLPLPAEPLAEGLELQGFILLPILPRHIEVARRLEILHNDSFDRLLIAQAADETLIMLTRDSAILGFDLDFVQAG